MATRSRNIYDAAKTGDLEYLRSAREQSIDLSARNKIGWTPMHCAAAADQVGVLNYLMRDLSISRSVTTLAPFSGSIVNVLSFGFLSDRSLGSIRHQSLGHLAAEGGCRAALDYLSINADLDHYDADGFTPMHLAAMKNKVEAFQRVASLVNYSEGESKALLSKPDTSGNPPLHLLPNLATRGVDGVNRNNPIFDIYISKGLNHLKNTRGETAAESISRRNLEFRRETESDNTGD